MVGETISHYRILAQIGAGGMGVVYSSSKRGKLSGVCVPTGMPSLAGLGSPLRISGADVPDFPIPPLRGWSVHATHSTPIS
jgi:hypothetical protein